MCSATSSSKVHSCTRLGTETVTFNLSISELRFTWLAICSHYAMLAVLTIGIHQIIIIIIIINEKINVAFSRRTARTRNSHKKTQAAR